MPASPPPTPAREARKVPLNGLPPSLPQPTLQALGLPAVTPSNASGSVSVAGPLSGVVLSYKNLLDFSVTSNLSTPSYSLPGAMWGMVSHGT